MHSYFQNRRDCPNSVIKIMNSRIFFNRCVILCLALLALAVPGPAQTSSAPPVPTNLTATAGDGTVSVSWDSLASADNYRLYRAAASGGPYTYIAYLSNSSTTFTDNSLSNGTYYYVLTAGNAAGTSGYSNEAAATLSVGTPIGLLATPGDGAISVSWGALAGADYYQLFRSTTPGGPYTYIAYLNGSTTSFADNSLSNGTYYYVVRAGNNGGQGSYSDEASAALSIGTPTGLTAVGGDGSTSLSWNVLTGADYYQLFRSTTPGGPYTYIAYLNGSTTSFTDNSLANGTYYYVIRAGNNGGQSGYSSEISAALSIAAPSNLTATVKNGSAVNLTWGASPGADYYQLFRAAVSGGTYTYIAYLPGSVHTFVDNNLAVETPYFYVIRAGNNGGQSDYSNEAVANIPFGLASINISPASVAGGSGVTGYVYLNGPAPAGGATVNLSSSDPSTIVPATVSISAGYTYAYFPITTTPVSAETTVAISAAYNNTSAAASLTVDPLKLSDLQVYPATVVGGNASTGYVYLNGPAPVGGLVVSLTSSNSAVTTPPTVTIPAGSTGNSFAITTAVVNASTTAAVTANCDGVSKTVTLTVNPLSLSNFYISPGTVAGGNASTGYLYLNGPAPGGSASVQLSSSDPAVSMPASVSIPAGQSGASFPIATQAVATPIQAAIQASYSGASVTATLNVNPLQPTGLGISPNPVLGGNTTIGYVYLNGNAPAGGASVSLSSGSAFAGVPVSVTVPEGASSNTFNIRTTSVDTAQIATITAALNNGFQSAPLTITPANPMAPPIPTGLSLSPGDGAAIVSWNASAGADYYCIQRANKSGGPYSVVGYAYSPTTTFTNTGLSNNTPYYYVIYAGNSNGPSANCPEVTTTLSLSPPTGLTATPGDGSVDLSWNAAPGADYYQLSRSTMPGGPYTVVAQLNQGTTTFTDIRNSNGNYYLPNGTYYYVVTAGDNGGMSGYSSEASATLSISAPTGLAAMPGDGFVSLTWNGMNNADSFTLYRATTSGGPYTAIAAFTSGTSTFTDIRNSNGNYYLPNGTYYYVLLARNSGGISSYSNEATATLFIAAPTGLKAVAGDGLVNLSWNTVSGADYYRLFRSTTPGGPYNAIAQLTQDTTAFTDIRNSNGNYYVPNGTYYYVVLAGNNGGTSGYSNEATTLLSIAAPTNLTATPGDGSVALSWDAVTGADSYTLYRATISGGSYTPIASLGSGTNTFTDIRNSNGNYYVPNGTYYYVVSAANNGGKSGYSNEATATLSTPAPMDLTATAGDGSVSLSWTGATGADYYQVYRATTSGGPYTAIAQTSQGTMTFTDIRNSNGNYYVPNGTYYYVVLAGNNGGQSVYSNEATVTLSIAAPMNLTATLIAYGGVLNWQPVSGADYYQVYRATTSGGPYTVIAQTSQGTTTFTDTRNSNGNYGLPDGTYYYVVLAGDYGGQSAYSNESSLTVIPVVTGLTFNPNPVLGGSSATGTVSMNGVSQVDCIINLAGGNAAATLPATVTVSAGQTSATFSISTTTVTSITPDDVTAVYAGLTTQATLSLVPLLGSVTLSPNPVPGGYSVNGSVTLNGPAPDGGLAVALFSDSAVVTIPASVTVLAGANSASFTGATTVVTNPATATVTATSGGATVGQRLQIDPIEPLSLSILPPVVVGGDSALGTVTLNRTAYAGGTVVALSCDSSSIIVPPTVTVLAGQASATFPVATNDVNQSVLGTVSASLSGKVRQASLTVQPLFTLAANAANVNAFVSGGALESSTSSTLTLTAGAVTSMTLPVSLSLGILPTGVTGWLSASAATVPAATAANTWNPATAGRTVITLYLVAAPNAIPGSYPITVVAVKDGYSVSTIVTLTVAP